MNTKPAFNYDIAAQAAQLGEDGIIGLKGAFSPEWADEMREDMMTAFWSAIQRPGGAVSRGPRRWYVEFIRKPFAASSI